MLKTTKKLLMVLLAGVMMFSMAACSKDTSGGGIGDVDLSQDTIISKEPVEFTLFHPTSNRSDGQWLILDEAAKMTNVKLNLTVSKSLSDYDQAFNLMLASGEMDDIITCYNASLFTKYGVEGAFVPLNEYLDIMPNLKKHLDENPEIKKMLTSYDGNIYYLPVPAAGLSSMGWFIRTDWLEKLGLEAPTTTEELYDVLVAFRDRDPNGNGIKDEIPYFSTRMTKTIFDGVECLYPLWGGRPSWYAENGTVKFGPYEPAYKDAMINVAKWYKEGLIDQEIYTRGSNARAELFDKNTGGSTHDWFGSTAVFNINVPEKVEGFEIKAIPPINGIEAYQRPVAYPYGWAISSQCKDIETVAKYFDFWYSEKGTRLFNFGFEGVHYDMVDGKPQFKPELLAREDFQSVIKNDGVLMEIGAKGLFDPEEQWLHPIAAEGMKMYDSHPEWFLEPFPTLTTVYLPEEFEVYSELYTPIKTYVDETVQKWILGISDVESTYDAFIAQLEKLGIKELIEVQQKAYTRYNQ